MRAIQYRPDLANCAAVAAFLGMPYDGCHVSSPASHAREPFGTTHAGRRWILPGQWLVEYDDGIAVMDPEEFARRYRLAGHR